MDSFLIKDCVKNCQNCKHHFLDFEDTKGVDISVSCACNNIKFNDTEQINNHKLFCKKLGK